MSLTNDLVRLANSANVLATAISTNSTAITAINVNSSSLSGNLTFTGIGSSQRITGDFSNNTLSSRAFFQSSITNSSTDIMAVPSGIGTLSQFSVWSSNDPSNSNLGAIRITSGVDVRLISSKQGSASSFLPMTFYTGGSEVMRIDSTGNVGIGTSSPAAKLDVNGTTYHQGNVILGSSSVAVGLQANSSYGTAGQVLTSNGTATYWSTTIGKTIAMAIVFGG